MNHTATRRLFRQVGIVSLALFLIACSAGLGYVAHITRETARQVQAAAQPSLLPLVVMALMAAVAGLVTLRSAFGGRSDADAY